MDALNIMNTLKRIQAVINSQPGLNDDGSIVDNRLSIIKRKVDEFEDKKDFFYYLLIKLISMNLSEIYNREYRSWIGLVLSENEELIPQPLSRINNFISSHFHYIDAIQQADRDFSINLFEYVCDVLENNKDIMLDVETLIRLLDRSPELLSSDLKGQYCYRTYNFSRLAKIMKDNQTLEKSNISVDNVYQILIQTCQLNNEGVFGVLIKPEEFESNHEAVNLALLNCYANVFVEITNIIRKYLDKDFDRLAIAKLKNYDYSNFCGEVIIELLRSNEDEEDRNFINQILADSDIEIDYSLCCFGTTLKEILALRGYKINIAL